MSTLEDFEYRLSKLGRISKLGRRERIVHPQHLKDEDITKDAFITAGPMLTEANLRRFFFQYLVMFVVAKEHPLLRLLQGLLIVGVGIEGFGFRCHGVLLHVIGWATHIGAV